MQFSFNFQFHTIQIDHAHSIESDKDCRYLQLHEMEIYNQKLNQSSDEVEN